MRLVYRFLISVRSQVVYDELTLYTTVPRSTEIFIKFLSSLMSLKTITSNFVSLTAM